MVDYKVSYRNIITNDNSYNQEVNIKCSKKKFNAVNKRIKDTINYIKSQTIKSEAQMNFVSYCHPFVIGDNYCTLTMIRTFACEFGLISRLKLDRNTIIRFRVY